MDGVRRELGCQLLCHGSNALSGQAILPGGKAPHDKLKQPRRHMELPVEEDASQEGPEESVNDGI